VFINFVILRVRNFVTTIGVAAICSTIAFFDASSRNGSCDTTVFGPGQRTGLKSSNSALISEDVRWSTNPNINA
jgi:hypothetical protein